jgi:hypothetical protein
MAIRIMTAVRDGERDPERFAVNQFLVGVIEALASG